MGLVWSRCLSSLFCKDVLKMCGLGKGFRILVLELQGAVSYPVRELRNILSSSAGMASALNN